MTFAQYSSEFYELNYARSIKSSAMGWQGVASLNSTEAMQYNPAGLVFTDSVSVSYFRDPFYMFGIGNGANTSIKMGLRLGKYGNIGFEYQNYNLGEIKQYDVNENLKQTIEPYKRSLALGYAKKISSEVSVGAELRYAWEDFYNILGKNGKLMVSAGMLYQPEKLKQRFVLGLSLLNFGSPVEITDNGYTSSFPMPASLNLGMNILPVKNNFFDAGFELSAVKPLEKRSSDDDNSAQSSFKSLFNDWGNSPDDITGSIGFAYMFHPINLGSGVSFIQEMYLGYLSSGPQWTRQNYFTHGFKVGLQVKDIKFTAGYAGRWHSNSEIYLTQELPWENFEFSISSNLGFLNKQQTNFSENNTPKNIVLSAGYTMGLVFGRMKGLNYLGYSINYDNMNDFQVCADFYLNDNMAITSSFEYAKLNETAQIHESFSGYSYKYTLEINSETFSLESGFRYHPLNNFHPLFVQASLGVIRINPVIGTNPSYYYKPYDRIIAGCVIPFENEKIVITPKIALRTIFMENAVNDKYLLGYSQFELGVNIGYKF